MATARRMQKAAAYAMAATIDEIILNNGEWFHLALTRNADDGIVTLYFEGNQIFEGTTTVDPTGFDWANQPGIWLLGHPTQQGDTRFRFPASLDELRIYDGLRYTGTSFTPPDFAAETNANIWILFE